VKGARPINDHEHKARAQALKIAIIGAGSIGTAWAIVFAVAGHSVVMHDSDLSRHDASRQELVARLSDLAREGLVSEPVDAIVARIAYCEDLTATVRDAFLVQECILEELAAKQTLYAALESNLTSKAIVASSSSFIKPSALFRSCSFHNRSLVVHPGNPPYLLRVVEVVPTPFTDAATTASIMNLISSAGMTPILVRREIEGFIFNRLQGALLREAYALVRDGAATAADIDRLVRDGLGLRWSVVGPFESTDLNTRGGIAMHAKRMLPAYRRMGEERGETTLAWPPETLQKVIAERREVLALEDWASRVEWRDRELMALLAHRLRRAKRQE
jgi:L-gulonate 3-dehydrogenase